jgi:hypothetical protein
VTLAPVFSVYVNPWGAANMESNSYGILAASGLLCAPFGPYFVWGMLAGAPAQLKCPYFCLKVNKTSIFKPAADHRDAVVLRFYAESYPSLDLLLAGVIPGGAKQLKSGVERAS